MKMPLLTAAATCQSKWSAIWQRFDSDTVREKNTHVIDEYLNCLDLHRVFSSKIELIWIE